MKKYFIVTTIIANSLSLSPLFAMDEPTGESSAQRRTTPHQQYNDNKRVAGLQSHPSRLPLTSLVSDKKHSAAPVIETFLENVKPFAADIATHMSNFDAKRTFPVAIEQYIERFALAPSSMSAFFEGAAITARFYNERDPADTSEALDMRASELFETAAKRMHDFLHLGRSFVGTLRSYNQIDENTFLQLNAEWQVLYKRFYTELQPLKEKVLNPSSSHRARNEIEQRKLVLLDKRKAQENRTVLLATATEMFDVGHARRNLLSNMRVEDQVALAKHTRNAARLLRMANSIGLNNQEAALALNAFDALSLSEDEKAAAWMEYISERNQ